MSEQGSRGCAFAGAKTLWPAWGSRREAELGSVASVVSIWVASLSGTTGEGPEPVILLGLLDRALILLPSEEKSEE